MKKLLSLLVLVFLVALTALPASAHDQPTVEVSDQVVLNGWVSISHVTSEGPGFIVIHIDNGGSPGPVIGQTAVHNGEQNNVRVQIDTTMATPMLFAMLHADTGEIGVYEFGAVEGADGPVSVDGAVVTPSFNVQIISAYPQLVSGSFTVANAVTDAPGWIVIHSDNEGAPGPVLGAAALTAGNNANVVVEIEGEATSTVFPMLHVDTGEAGVYEFGTVEGADSPVRVNDVVAVGPVATHPTIIMSDQIAVHGDGYAEMAAEMGMEMMAPAVWASAVLSDGPGFLVIHSDNEGAPGPVAGFAALADGLNTNVMVELDPEVATPVLWPMLHVDTGEAGVYEFGAVEGADGPVSVNDQVVTFPINAAPSFQADAQAVEMGHIVISSALIDAPGWIAIHSSVDGSPGPVIGTAPLNVGWNGNIVVDIDFSMAEGAATDQVFPMLHYDTGEIGAYEFGAVEGADGPVRVNEAVVVGPLEIMQ